MDKKDIAYVVDGLELENRNKDESNTEKRLEEYRKMLEKAELRRIVHG